jgi:hypothetical protein
MFKFKQRLHGYLAHAVTPYIAPQIAASSLKLQQLIHICIKCGHMTVDPLLVEVMEEGKIIRQDPYAKDCAPPFARVDLVQGTAHYYQGEFVGAAHPVIWHEVTEDGEDIGAHTAKQHLQPAIGFYTGERLEAYGPVAVPTNRARGLGFRGIVS